MCGIAGILCPGAPRSAQTLIGRMTDAQRHRGPDGEGVRLLGCAALGHRRLSILDLAGGGQPMSNADGRLWITYNGELYNHLDLRRELETLGHSFRTRSDTEVVVHAYEQWADDCVLRLRGMFAFAVHDAVRGRIFLARDHFGIKPLFYCSAPGLFAFASEAQGLLALPGVGGALDLDAINQYLWLQYIPAPASAWKDIRKLPPAQRMSVDLDGSIHEPEEYWEFRFQPDPSPSADDWLEELDATLMESVRAHMMADVPFGAFLSGGVDSAAVVACMARQMDAPVRTFSIGFAEERFNELSFARQVARRWGLDHHEEIVRPDALALLPDLVRHYGEPFGDSSAIPTYYVSRLARRQVPLVLSGDGGDELFGGYDSYRAWMSGHEPGEPADPDATGADGVLRAWMGNIHYFSGDYRQRLWLPELHAFSDIPPEAFARAFRAARGGTRCHMAQTVDARTYLPFDILTKVDVASMMHGLEVRTPLVDLRVAGLAARMPETLNVGRAPGTGQWRGKLLLKRLMERFYPAELLHRPKQGFAMPLAQWFAPGGALRPTVERRLLGADSQLWEFFARPVVEKIIQVNAAGPIWVLLVLEEWLRQEKARARERGHG